jgi:hypothetical protein
MRQKVFRFLLLRQLSATCLAVVSCLALPVAFAADATPSASEAMAAARKGRQVWRSFPGFQARVVATRDGERQEFDLVVSSNGDIKSSGTTDGDWAWVKSALDSVIGHRFAESEETASDGFVYVDGDEAVSPQGRLIRSTGPMEKSQWRVRGDVLTEVHRISEKTHLRIGVSEVWRTPDGLHLPRSFSVVTWDRGTGAIRKVRNVHQSWERMGAFDLPRSWRVCEDQPGQDSHVMELEFSDLRLTETSVSVSRTDSKSTP